MESSSLVLNISANWLIYSVEFLVIVGLLAGSAFMSGSEVAFFSLTPQQLLECRSQESNSAKKLVRLLNAPKRLLATILILNNLINVSIVTLSTYMMLDIIGNDADQAIAISLLTFLTSTAIVFFGEVIPKVFATQKNMPVALVSAHAFVVFNQIFMPFSSLLMMSSGLIERRFKKRGYDVSVEELNEALEMTVNNETPDEQKEILKGIVNFGSITARQIMRSRVEITAADVDSTFYEILDYINKSGYSRVPIYKDTIDKIEGFLYIKDLLPYLNQTEEFEWQNLIRKDTFFVPENKKIGQLMKEFQAKRVHIAIVVDEYGGTSGLVTLEDIIEEIVGEINDEFDTSDIFYKRIDKNTYIFEGKIALHDFCKLLSVDTHLFDEVKADNESLGGLLLELFHRLPRVGEKIGYKDFMFVITAADQKRIKTVRVLVKDKPENA